MKKLITWLLLLALVVPSVGCSSRNVTWNGETGVLADLFLVIDCTNLYEYVGFADHVFVGTVEGAEYGIPEERTAHEQSYSEYEIRVDANLKGELIESITCSKSGGIIEDGTMLLVRAETPSGEIVMDSGLPEVGKQYVFLAYAQPDGSLVLSEIFDNREYDEALLAEYQDYVENEIPFERERFVSAFDKEQGGEVI